MLLELEMIGKKRAEERARVWENECGLVRSIDAAAAGAVGGRKVTGVRKLSTRSREVLLYAHLRG